MKRIRAFVALDLPLTVIRSAGAVQTELRPLAAEAGLRVRWVPQTNMHVTLKFLGEIPEESSVAITARLSNAFTDLRPIPVTLSGVGAFPDAEKPRVLWIGLKEQGDALSALAQRVDTALDELGFPKEKKPFSPHLTLGRVKEGQGDVIGELADREVGECVARDVALYRSVLHQSGAEYKALAKFSLGGK